MNNKLETAVNLAWTAGNSNTRFGIAAKYQLDPDASFSVSNMWTLLFVEIYSVTEADCLILPELQDHLTEAAQQVGWNSYASFPAGGFLLLPA